MRRGLVWGVAGLLALTVSLPAQDVRLPTDFHALVQRMVDVEFKATALEQRATMTDGRVAILEQAVSDLAARVTALEGVMPPPPAPVDWVGTWSAWSQTSCTTCVNGLQDCTETRTFVVTTQPANGGAVCPVSPETRTVTQTCAGTPPPPSGDHAYFDGLRARPEHYASYSMRDQNQLLQFRQKQGDPPAVNYLYPNDPDPRQQDAAKVVIPSNTNNLQNQVRFPISGGTQDGHTYLFTWDAWFGAEYAQATTGYKTFQISAANSSIWCEVQNRPPNSIGDPIGLRIYGTYGSSGTTNNAPVRPTVGEVLLPAETWVRYWVEIQQRAGALEIITLWAADETHDPVLIVDHVGLGLPPSNTIDKFWLEYNTSDSFVDPRPALVSYVRNFVVLRDVANPTALMVKP